MTASDACLNGMGHETFNEYLRTYLAADKVETESLSNPQINYQALLQPCASPITLPKELPMPVSATFSWYREVRRCT